MTDSASLERPYVRAAPSDTVGLLRLFITFTCYIHAYVFVVFVVVRSTLCAPSKRSTKDMTNHNEHNENSCKKANGTKNACNGCWEFSQVNNLCYEIATNKIHVFNSGVRYHLCN
jgi:hypothetical protein